MIQLLFTSFLLICFFLLYLSRTSEQKTGTLSPVRIMTPSLLPAKIAGKSIPVIELFGFTHWAGVKRFRKTYSDCAETVTVTDRGQRHREGGLQGKNGTSFEGCD